MDDLLWVIIIAAAIVVAIVLPAVYYYVYLWSKKRPVDWGGKGNGKK